MGKSGRDSDAEHDGNGRMDTEPGGETDHEAEGSPDAESKSEGENGDGEKTGDQGPVEVGDNREKYVTITERSGERTEHDKVYLRHTTGEFVISSDDSFPSTETTRYPKADLLRVEIAQHHSTCFITTAAVGKGETLDSLRAFRDDVLRPTAAGSALVDVYERISPPIAYTLRTHPTARTTRLVRWLVTHSSTLSRRREATSKGSHRRALALTLTLVYLFGICCALGGHIWIRLRESFAETLSAESTA